MGGRKREDKFTLEDGEYKMLGGHTRDVQRVWGEHQRDLQVTKSKGDIAEQGSRKQRRE